MGQLIARRAKTVWAVEENHRAVRDGIESLALNGIDNLRFAKAAASWFWRGVSCPTADGGGARPAPGGLRAHRAQSRDEGRAPPGGLRVLRPGHPRPRRRLPVDRRLPPQKSVPVDLFPQTAHIESVSLFERK
jgi:hypothetical protein